MMPGPGRRWTTVALCSQEPTQLSKDKYQSRALFFSLAPGPRHLRADLASILQNVIDQREVNNPKISGENKPDPSPCDSHPFSLSLAQIRVFATHFFYLFSTYYGASYSL